MAVHELPVARVPDWLPPLPPRRAGWERIPRACDALLDLGVLAFATWTLVYGLCALLGLTVEVAASAAVALAGAVAWWWLRSGDAPAPARSGPRPRGRRLPAVTLALPAAAALAAASLFASMHGRWIVVSALWIVAAAGTLAWRLRRDDRAGFAPASRWADPVVVAAWAGALATLSLFLVNPDGDDAYYVHLSAWIGVHGRFPLHDVMFSNDVLPALYSPPVWSYDALVGALAHLLGVPAADVAYLGVPPVASALWAVVLWRLLRSWDVRMAWVAVSVSATFLLFGAAGKWTLGDFFIERIWQGKALLLALLLPLLFALLHEYAAAPSRRRLVLLGAGGVAGVGLSLNGAFIVPVVAVGTLAAAGLPPRRALAGIAATCAYPAFAGVLALALGGHTPDRYTDAEMVSPTLVHLGLGTGVSAFAALAAVLVGPALLPRARSGRSVSGAVLLVGLLFLPQVPLAIFHVTGLGRVLWRLTWAMPATALVGAACASLVTSRRGVIVRVLPALAACAIFVTAGTPVWSSSARTIVVSSPTWKRLPWTVEASRAILRHARPNDIVLAPWDTSWTLLAASGSVTTVSPRLLYLEALHGVPATQLAARRLLGRLGNGRLRAPASPGAAAAERRAVRVALHAVGVDIACVGRHRHHAQRLLSAGGYVPAFRAGRLSCLTPRPPGPA